MQALSQVPAKELLHDVHSLVSVSPKESVQELLTKLATHNIYSVPVISDGHVHGLVDLADLLAYLVHVTASQTGVALGHQQETLQKLAEHHYNAQELENLKNTFFHAQAEKLVNYSKQNAYHALPIEGSSLKDIAEALAKEGVHRVALCGPNGAPVKIVSQSALIAYFAKHLEKLGPIADQTLEQAGCITKKLIMVSPEMRTLDAFATLVEHRISALAYLGEEGDVLGNLSVKDLKGVLIAFNNLTLPVVEYVNIIRRETTVRDIPPLVSVQPTETVGKAVQKLAAVGIHRLYTFEGPRSRTPSGMVALSDIMKLLRK